MLVGPVCFRADTQHRRTSLKGMSSGLNIAASCVSSPAPNVYGGASRARNRMYA